MGYGKGHPLIAQAINDAKPPAHWKKGYKGTRQDISLDALAGLCYQIGADVNEVLAIALLPEMAEVIGHDKQAKLAMELLKLAEGKTVTVNGEVKHHHTHESVSETDAWLEGIIRTDEDESATDASSH